MELLPGKDVEPETSTLSFSEKWTKTTTTKTKTPNSKGITQNLFTSDVVLNRKKKKSNKNNNKMTY